MSQTLNIMDPSEQFSGNDAMHNQSSIEESTLQNLEAIISQVTHNLELKTLASDLNLSTSYICCLFIFSLSLLISSMTRLELASEMPFTALPEIQNNST